MIRFNKAALEIRDLNLAVALHHLTTALKPGPFANNICKKPPTDMDDLRRRADKYIQMKELAEFRNQARAEVVAKPEKPTESFRSRPKELVPREKPPRGPRYHRNRGHSTEECSALKDKIEDLIKQGQLQGFVDRQNTSQYTDRSRRHDQPEQRKIKTRSYRERSRSRDRREEEPSTQPQRVINTIAGGFVGGGSSSSTQRRHLRAVRHVHAVEKVRHRLPSITFTEADFKGIDPDQDDPMGSSADILYRNKFKQLGIPESELVPYDDPLVGFSGERVKTKGYIKLSTRFGFEEAEYRDVSVKYVVVHANTSYNILLGRTSLNRLGAIVSTPHLAMKFLYETGRVITIHADQKTARECYFASLRLPKMNREVPEEPRRIHSVSQQSAIDLDPQIDQDERVEPIEDKQPLQVRVSDS
ncbi:uncharacterized protein LOC109788888 [Cajanus cajan]|uniref:uncharacterized protein LOC109788888 n=1 Tax=Cajanus cajan TaxID=3821 RepID=UPI00098DAB87|nr:uncharacterized protein LOC109788888 [Cajanus cajan]